MIAYNTNIVTNSLIYCLDSGGQRSYSPNVLPYPVDLYSWFVGSNGNCTIARDTTTGISPAGGIPLKMSITGNDPYMATYNASQYSLATASSGQTWTASVWIKSSVATTAEIFLFGDSAAGGQVFTIVNYGAGSVNVTTAWTRVSFSFTFTNALVQRVQVRLDGTNSGGTGIDIWWDGLQVERNSTPSTFCSIPNKNAINWLDISGSNYNSVLTNGPLYTNFGATGVSSYVTFDGVDDFSLSTGLQTFGNDMTWEAWVYCTQDISTYNMFMGRYLPYFSFFSGNRLYFSNNIGGTQQTIETASNMSLNTWYHAAFTTSYSNPNTTMKIYTNGVETATATYAGTQQQYSTGFMVGDGNNGSNLSWYPFKGRIGCVKVYNRALSANEVAQNFNALRPRYGI